MAAPVLQSVDPSHPSLDSAQPGPSRTATVADESDEIAAEAGIVSNGVAAAGDGVAESAAGAAAGPAPGGAVAGEEDEEEVDPDAIQPNACETLYIQNLNEKVQTQGESDVLVVEEGT